MHRDAGRQAQERQVLEKYMRLWHLMEMLVEVGEEGVGRADVVAKIFRLNPSELTEFEKRHMIRSEAAHFTQPEWHDTPREWRDSPVIIHPVTPRMYRAFQILVGAHVGAGSGPRRRSPECVDGIRQAVGLDGVGMDPTGCRQSEATVQNRLRSFRLKDVDRILQAELGVLLGERKDLVGYQASLLMQASSNDTLPGLTAPASTTSTRLSGGKPLLQHEQLASQALMVARELMRVNQGVAKAQDRLNGVRAELEHVRRHSRMAP